jgi:hypothetical protein
MDTNFIPLESIQIATPCRADWNQMTGDEQSRFCGSCAKNVYDFSAMTRAEAQQLLLEKEGHLCVRLHRRADGTVITSDCPVGISPVKRSAGWLRGLMTAVVTALVGVLGVQAAPKVSVTAGAPSVPKTKTTKTKATKVAPLTGIVAPHQIMGRPAVPQPLLGEVLMAPTPKPMMKSGKSPVKKGKVQPK